MSIKDIKKANELVDQLEDYEKRLKSLGNSKGADYIQIRNYQSGAPEYSYEVTLRDHEDREFLKIVKSMIEARLISKIETLKKQIEEV